MELSTDHADPSLGITLLMQATGVTNRDFFDGLVGQLLNACMTGEEPDERGLNIFLSMVRG